MIRCFCCEHFLDYEKVAEMDKPQYDLVPETVIELLADMKLSCKAFPDVIPDEFLRLQNEQASEQAVYCANGYQYNTLSNIIECVGPGQALWKFLWATRKEHEVYDEKLQRIVKLVEEYTRCSPIWAHRQLFPWEHPAKEFSKMLIPPIRTDLNASGGSIIKCRHNETTHLFGIELPIPLVTDDMLDKGEWYIYTWCI